MFPWWCGGGVMFPWWCGGGVMFPWWCGGGGLGGAGLGVLVRPAVQVGLQVGQHAAGQAGGGVTAPLAEQRLHHVTDEP